MTEQKFYARTLAPAGPDGLRQWEIVTRLANGSRVSLYMARMYDEDADRLAKAFADAVGGDHATPFTDLQRSMVRAWIDGPTLEGQV